MPVNTQKVYARAGGRPRATHRLKEKENPAQLPDDKRLRTASFEQACW